MNVPIIRLEVQQMQYAVHAMLTEHCAMMDASVKAAVDAYCTPGNIDLVVQSEVKAAMDEAVKEEIRKFFRYDGNGRLAIRAAVVKFLDEMYPLK